MRIDACTDSHVHWAATGEFAARIDLSGLRSATDLLKLEVPGTRGDWILGHGWDDTEWKEKPSLALIDQWQSDRPVAFSRADGHTLWVNGEALRRANLTRTSPDPEGGRLVRDASNELTGVLVDRASDLVRDLVPKPGAFEIRRHLLKATQIFNEAGFTHIRDMTCDEAQFQEAVRLDGAGLLTLAVEEFFWASSVEQIDKTLDSIRRAREVVSPNLRVLGLKLFLDGALGSEGAWLSRCYHGRDHSGLALWSREALITALRLAWEAQVDVAVHAIGDRAAELLADAGLELRTAGLSGQLHVEHGELLRPETILKLKSLRARVHMQPAHWLADRRWLKEKLGDLTAFAFPWRALQEHEVDLDFGSDAPMDPPSIERIFAALEKSPEEGIPRLLGSPVRYLSHRDLGWAPNSFTLFEERRPKSVVFRGEHIFSV